MMALKLPILIAEIEMPKLVFHSTVRFFSKFGISKYCNDRHSRMFWNLMEFNENIFF